MYIFFYIENYIKKNFRLSPFAFSLFIIFVSKI